MSKAPSRLPASGRSLTLILLAGAALSACATPQPKYAAWTPGRGQAAQPSGAGGRYKVGDPYQVAGIWYVPKEQPDYDETGTASWYGDAFNNKSTANGEIFDMHAISAAHPTLPMPSIVEVTNLDNGRKLQVRVNDRGPYVAGRLIDLSQAAARELGYDSKGLAHVRVRYVGPAPLGQMAARPQTAPANDGFSVSAPSASSVVTAAAVTAAPIAVASAALPAALPSAASAAAPAAIPQAASAATGSIAPVLTNGYRIQAGAFADSAKAARIAAQLGETAEATVEPVSVNGVTLYRVLVSGGEQEAGASALRETVAALGYPDARILRPN